MSDFVSKLEELKERRSNALNSIASSIADKNEARETDAINNRYIFGDSQNTYGILDLLYWYQKERYYEARITYNNLLTLLGSKVDKGSFQSKISHDVNQVTNMSAPDNGYKYTDNYFYKIDKDYNASINYGAEIIDSNIAYFNLNSIFFNSGEDVSARRTAHVPLSDALGASYTDNDIAQASYTSDYYAAADNISDRGSGILKYWNSKNRIHMVSPPIPGGEDPQPGTVSIGYDHDKVWVWQTTTTNEYKTPDKISAFYTAFETFISDLESIKSILDVILTIYQYAESSSYWTEILDDIESSQSVLTYQNSINTLIRRSQTAYNLVKDYKTSNLKYDHNSPPSSGADKTIYDNINTMIDLLSGSGGIFETSQNVIGGRLSAESSYMGTGINNGLRKWINFWLTEKISLETGSYSQLCYLNTAIDDEAEELKKTDERILTIITSGTALIMTPQVKAAYSDPKYDRKSGVTTQRRIGTFWDGQFHAKKYNIFRKNIKSFDYVHTTSDFYFFKNNADWTKMMTDDYPDLPPGIPAQKGNERTFTTEIDPEYGFVTTERLENINDEETYIYRVSVEDINSPIPGGYDFKNVTRIADLYDPYIGKSVVTSNQSKVYDPDTVYHFTSIKNGVIKLANNPFRKGSFIVIKSNYKDDEYDRREITINGIHRIIDYSEDSFVLEGLPETSFPGVFYPVYGVVTTKNIPIITYENDQAPVVTTTSKETSSEPAAVLGDIYVRRDGTSDLTGNWNAGNYTIINRRIETNEFNLNGMEFENSGADNKDVLRVDEDGNIIFDDLSDLQPATILNISDPGVFSVGELGQFWLNTTNQQLWQCVDINDGTYLWKNLSGSGMIIGDTYIHIQTFPWTEWNIDHNLGKYPSVTLVNDDNVVIEGKVKYDSESHITVTFTTPQSGRAYLNWGKTMTRAWPFTNVDHVVVNDYYNVDTFNKHYPSVTIVDTNNEIIEGKVQYSDSDIIDVYFTENMTGTIYLN